MEKEEKKYFITGNTFGVKDQLKELGCKWDTDCRPVVPLRYE